MFFQRREKNKTLKAQLARRQFINWADGWGPSEDLNGALLFLVSPASDYLSGVVLPADGGFMGR